MKKLDSCEVTIRKDWQGLIHSSVRFASEIYFVCKANGIYFLGNDGAFRFKSVETAKNATQEAVRNYYRSGTLAKYTLIRKEGE